MIGAHCLSIPGTQHVTSSLHEVMVRIECSALHFREKRHSISHICRENANINKSTTRLLKSRYRRTDLCLTEAPDVAGSAGSLH